jgi:hypothetical protein
MGVDIQDRKVSVVDIQTINVDSQGHKVSVVDIQTINVDSQGHKVSMVDLQEEKVTVVDLYGRLRNNLMNPLAKLF